jgi:drug/metabolite transporter superfamily protein YnfA
MEPNANRKAQADGADFARQTSEGQTGYLREVWLFLRGNKKWWLTPLLVILLVFGVLVALCDTAAAPLIYTLF